MVKLKSGNSIFRKPDLTLIKIQFLTLTLSFYFKYHLQTIKTQTFMKLKKKIQKVINSPDAVARASNKLNTMEVLRMTELDLPVPFTRDIEEALVSINMALFVLIITVVCLRIYQGSKNISDT